MTEKTTSELSLIEAIPFPALDPDSKQAKAAIRRCSAAWKRAYDACMKGASGDRYDEIVAARKASTAYCKVMPYLSDYESIRKFIACAAHGILIGAIPQKRANQLLYAAQVALASLNFGTKQRKS